MRLVWIERSTLDYRLPVYKALNDILKGNFYLLYNRQVMPERVSNGIKAILGNNAYGMDGEIRIGKPYTPDEFQISPIRYFHQPGLRKLVLSLSPDVMVSCAFNHWTIPAFLIRLTHRIPHIITYERTEHTERHSPWVKRVARKATFPLIDAMCVNGILSKKYVISLGYPAEKITMGHMVADVKGLAIRNQNSDSAKIADHRKSLGIPDNILVFISVSRLIKLKGIAEFLKGWAAFSAKAEQPVHLLIVGDGPERENLESACREYGITAVTFAGAVDYREVYRYYALADLFFISTLEDNWSLVVPEAMACGLPVLCSKYNGCWPELVTQENGWVFDPLNPAETAACLDACMAVRQQWPDMGKRSREIVGHHTPENAAKAILDACRIAVKTR